MPRPLLRTALVLAQTVIVTGLLLAPIYAAPRSQTDQPTVPLPRPVNAVGMVTLEDEYQVVLETSGRVEQIAVDVGDVVRQGGLLLALNTTALEEAVDRANFALENAQIGLEELTKAPEPSDVAVAEARLLQAQEQLALVAAGPTPDELDAARNAAAAAQARYDELKAGPRPSEITLAKANLAQAEVNLQEAQREYDKIAWLPEAAATDAADNLQRSTIAYEAARAAFAEASRPATTTDLLGALSSAQSAQHGLNQLEEKPTPAELADARAGLAAAENALDQLTREPEDFDFRKAELAVKQALLDVEQAERALANAVVRAPVAGTVIELMVEPGQQGSAGSHVATIADMSLLNLVVNVEQTDIPDIQLNQPVEVTLYAQPDRPLAGTVARIAPRSDTATGSVTFPVTIALTDDDLSGVRPGMTASAVFLSAAPEAE